MKKKLFCLVSLMAVFGVTSCNKSLELNNKNQDSNGIQDVNNYKDTDSARMAYEEFKYDLSYDEFLSKVEVIYDDSYIAYRYNALDIYFVFVLRDGAPVSCVRSEVGTIKHLKGYRYINSNWVEALDLDIQNDITTIDYNRDVSIDPNRWYFVLVSNYSYETLLSRIIDEVCICGFATNSKTYIKNVGVPKNGSVNITTIKDNKCGKIEYTYENYLPQRVIESKMDENDSWTYFKFEYEHNKNGDLFTRKYFEYINNEWVLIEKDKLVNDIMREELYVIFLDNAFWYKYEQVYDENGNVTEYIYYDYKDNEWIPSSKQECEYDENGNRITKIDYKYIESKWMISSKTEYDKNGEKISKTDFYFKNNKYNYYCKYEFDKNGNWHAEITYRYKDNEFVPHHKYEYEYDEKGKKIKEIHYEYINNEWVTVSKSKLINGNMLTEFVIHTKDNQLDSKYEYEYDEKGKKIKEIHYEYINNEWVTVSKSKLINGNMLTEFVIHTKDNQLDSKREYKYDENGHAITRIDYNYKENKWIPSSKYEEEYDNCNKIISQHYYKYKDNEWIFDAKTEYKYDDSASIISSTSFEYINDEWVVVTKFKEINGKMCKYLDIRTVDHKFKEKYEYEYDDNGNKITAIYSKYDGNDWVLSTKSEYEYDESGNEITQIDYKYYNEWFMISKWKLINGEKSKVVGSHSFSSEGKIISYGIYEYDDKGNIIVVINYHYDNKRLVPTIKYEYTHDDNGNSLTEVGSNYIDNEWVLSTKSEYEYDDKGNRIIEINYEHDGNGWVLSTKSEYEYDEKGEKIKEIHYVYINNEWVTVSKSKLINGKMLTEFVIHTKDNQLDLKREYKYDENGHTITRIDYNYKENKWIPSSKYEEEYDNCNKIISQHYYKYKDNEWIFDAKTEYKYDDSASIISSTSFEYINDEWVVVTKFKEINGKMCKYLDIRTVDHKFKEKYEYEYDDNGNKITAIYSKYDGNEWVPSKKYEWEYGTGWQTLTNEYVYENNYWVLVTK